MSTYVWEPVPEPSPRAVPDVVVRCLNAWSAKYGEFRLPDYAGARRLSVPSGSEAAAFMTGYALALPLAERDALLMFLSDVMDKDVMIQVRS